MKVSDAAIFLSNLDDHTLELRVAADIYREDPVTKSRKIITSVGAKAVFLKHTITSYHTPKADHDVIMITSLGQARDLTEDLFLSLLYSAPPEPNKVDSDDFGLLEDVLEDVPDSDLPGKKTQISKHAADLYWSLLERKAAEFMDDPFVPAGKLQMPTVTYCEQVLSWVIKADKIISEKTEIT